MPSELVDVNQTFIQNMEQYRVPDKSKGLIYACSQSPIVFAERMLGIKPYAWQVSFMQRILDSVNEKPGTNKEFVAITSRQIGKSTAVAILSMWFCLFNKYPGTTAVNTSVLITSASDVQAKKLLYEMKKLMRLGDAFMKRTYVEDDKPLFGEEFMTNLLDEHEPNNTTTITLKPYNKDIHGDYLLTGSLAGSTIKSYPPTAGVLGECEIAGAQVLLADGCTKSIENIKVGDVVISSNHFQETTSIVSNVKDNGIREVIKFTTCHGREITVTGNHPLMTKRGWTRADDITSSDHIATLANIHNTNDDYPITDDEIKFLGYMLGDGSTATRGNLKFTQLKGDQFTEFSDLCNRLGFKHNWQKDSRSKVYNCSISVNAWGLLESYGLAGKYSGTKALPLSFNKWSPSQQGLLLNRYFSCDGWFIDTTRKEIGLYSKSKKLIQQVQQTLVYFNIQSNVRKRVKGVFVGYELSIRSKSNIAKFIKDIGIFCKTDDKKIKVKVDQSKTHVFNDFEFEAIRSIEELPPQQTYGLTINDTQCYISNGILSHNTASVVIVDEAGKSDKISDQFFYDFLYPTGNSTDAIRIYTSTPWAPSGFFYRMVDPDDMYENTPADVVTFTVDAILIEAPDYHKVVMKTVNQLNADGKNDEVQRAYFCRFVKGEQSYFSPDDVMGTFTSDYLAIDRYEGQCDMGVDFGGQVKSKSVITITELTEEGTVRRLYHRAYPVGEDNNLIDDIAELLTKFNVQRIIPDDCPQGDYLIRQMKDKGWDVQPMNFRSDKVKKYGAFRSTLKRGKVVSYQDDDLKTEMLAMEYSAGARQSIIQHAPGYSDDLIDSFVMSAYFFIDDDTGFKAFSWEDDDD